MNIYSKIFPVIFLFFMGFTVMTSAAETREPGQLTSAGTTSASLNPGQATDADTPIVRMITPGLFEIGGVRLNKQEGTVEFDAVVNMNEGLLEYLIVGNGGKTHESLLRTEAEPYNIQIALLMIGLEGTMNPLSEQGDPRIPEGNPVTIWLRWEHDGKIENFQIERWVVNKNSGGVLSPMNWIFTGSIISNGAFMAQVEKSIVAIFHDPVALIDNPLKEGASDEIWYVNEKEAPPVGTKVTVTIRKAGKEGR